ncbi:MAG: hypothetical protein HYV07_21570 [Deltaproteobacteria bacterium]|nr:hypothetical protein [Deltaproteobacteria bacterium]
MTWYRRDDSLPDHPKTHRLRRILGVRLVEAVGWIDMFHGRVCQHRTDGDLSGLTPADIEDWLGWDGDSGRLYAALVESGWIDTDPLRVHG